MRSKLRMVILIAITTVLSCQKPGIEYGLSFPFQKIHEATVAMENWEISSTKYDYSLEARDIFFINKDTGFLVGNSGRIFKTTDSGEKWRKIESGITLNLISVFFTNDKVGYASSEGINRPSHDCSKGSYLLKTTDCGETWTKTIFPEFYRISSMKFFDESHGIAIIFTKGQNDTLKSNIATTSDGGSFWKIAGLELRSGVERLSFTNDLIFVQGRSQQLYKSTDHGSSWDTIIAPVIMSNSIRYLYFINEAIGYIDVMSGIYKTSDGGKTWAETQLPFPYPEPLYFYNENEGFRIKGAYFITDETASEGCIYYVTKDGGNTWSNGTLKELITMDNTHFPYRGTGFGFGKSSFYKYTRKGD